MTTKIVIDLLNLLIKTDRQERKVYEGMLSMQAYLDGKLEGLQTALELVQTLDRETIEREVEVSDL
jgi:hypothetical protein